MRSSWMIAAGLSVALGAWLATPYVLPAREVGPDENDVTADRATPVADEKLMRVQTRISQSLPVHRELVLNGRSEASRRVILRAEIDGRVIDLPLDKGDKVPSGAVVAALDERDKLAWETRAAAMLKEREIEYEAARKLGQKGFQAETKVAQSLAHLEEARATLMASQIQREHATIEASFAGILEDRMVEIGDFLQKGDAIAEVVELNPLIVTADVPETHYHRFAGGAAVEVVLAGFGRHEGRLHFLSSEADPDTRTFKVEFEIANAGLSLPAGVTTEVYIAFEAEDAHPLAPSLLTLDDSGRIGIKSVNALGAVEFSPAEIVKTDIDAVWLAGLADEIEVITIGQGFVKPGERVETVREAEEEPAKDALVAEGQ